jgi:hypothetical protein
MRLWHAQDIAKHVIKVVSNKKYVQLVSMLQMIQTALCVIQDILMIMEQLEFVLANTLMDLILV